MDEVKRQESSSQFSEFPEGISLATHESPSKNPSLFQQNPLKFKRGHVSAFLKFWVLVKRNGTNFTRELKVFLIFYIQGFFGVFLACCLYANLNRDYDEFSIESVTMIRNRIGSFFFLTIFYYTSYLSCSSFKMEMESQVIYKEIGSGYYNPLTYFTAKSIIDLIFLLPPTVLQVPVVDLHNLVAIFPAHAARLVYVF